VVNATMHDSYTDAMVFVPQWTQGVGWRSSMEKILERLMGRGW
jgi:hypothetical protein